MTLLVDKKKRNIYFCEFCSDKIVKNQNGYRVMAWNDLVMNAIVMIHHYPVW